MKYLKEYKAFYSSIKDPLEKLDEVQVQLNGLEIASDQINGNYELGRIPEEEYKTLSKEINSFFEWGKEEISILESECRDLIKKRKKKAEGGIMNLEKNPEYKGWKKIYMMSPDAAESHPKHEEFENYLKRKENKKADGGIMNLGGNEMDLRGGGFVPLGAKEKADDVPARLSKNEFVMTADAVRAAGGGSVDKGADKMYKMMKQLEAQV